MARPSKTALATATGAGLTNVGVVLALYARAAYPTLDSAAGTGFLAATGFVLGFTAVLVTSHTGLVSPAAGFFAVLSVTAYVELTSPLPEWSELNGYIIVDGPTHVGSYANTWYVWLALFLFAGAIEFGIRRGYGIGDRRLRNLPTLPFARGTIWRVVAGFAGLVGAATMLLALRAGIRPPSAALIVFVVAAVVAAVPLAALLAKGILLPTLLFSVFVPYMLVVEVFVATDSPVHILLFGPYAIVLAIAWAFEAAIRSRVRGWDGGRFTARERG